MGAAHTADDCGGGRHVWQTGVESGESLQADGQPAACPAHRVGSKSVVYLRACGWLAAAHTLLYAGSGSR